MAENKGEWLQENQTTWGHIVHEEDEQLDD